MVKERKMRCVYICLLIILVWIIYIVARQAILMKLGRIWETVLRNYLFYFILLIEYFELRSSFDYSTHQQWLRDLKWTPELTSKWQEFYNNASRVVISGSAGNFKFDELPMLPEYKDLKAEECKRRISNSATRHNAFAIFLLTIVINIFS